MKYLRKLYNDTLLLVENGIILIISSMNPATCLAGAQVIKVYNNIP